MHGLVIHPSFADADGYDYVDQENAAFGKFLRKEPPPSAERAKPRTFRCQCGGVFSGDVIGQHVCTSGVRQ